jgi:hypothetical protein
MCWVVTSAQLNQGKTSTGHNQIDQGVWVPSVETWSRVMPLNSSIMLNSIQ